VPGKILIVDEVSSPSDHALLLDSVREVLGET
jgi:hypothetical protein